MYESFNMQYISIAIKSNFSVSRKIAELSIKKRTINNIFDNDGDEFLVHVGRYRTKEDLV
jgi:hypothetical protein